MEPSAGQTLNNRYSVLHLLGTGGMGAVYFTAIRCWIGDVAIKQLQAEPITGPLLAEQFRAQFQREAQVLASLHHPNLPRVTDYFTEGRVALFGDGLHRGPDAGRNCAGRFRRT